MNNYMSKTTDQKSRTCLISSVFDRLRFTQTKNYRSKKCGNLWILKKNKRAEPAVVTIILLIFLVLTAVALIWRIVFVFVNEGAGEISYKSDCLKTKLEIVEVNNNFKDNLILIRGASYGRLTGIKVFLDNQNIEDMPLKIGEVEEKAFTIQSPLLRNNPDSVGKYVKIAKLVGNDFNSSKVCEPDGKSAVGGVKVISA